MASLTPEERQQLEDKRVARELQAKIDAEQKENTRELIELSQQKKAEREEAEALEEEKAEALQKQKAEAKLSTEDIQKIVAGFEAYNKSVKILLDMCVNVESEADFRQIGLLITEHGDEFTKNTANIDKIGNKLIAEGYWEHPVLGPLMNKSEMLVDQMSTCMELLALEFGG